MKPGLRNNSLFFIAILILLDAYVLPDIRLNSKLPAFQLIDFLLPLLLLLLAPTHRVLKQSWWAGWTFVFAAYMLIPIVVNGRISVFNDYFELYKIMKLGLLFILFQATPRVLFRRFIQGSFVVLILINFLHFYNVFQFNDGLKYLYGDSIHFQLFGKNSLGLPAVKRMLGTMGNPNTNALLFLFFATYFFPNKTAKEKGLYFLMALFMVFLCQSRTSLIAVACVVGYWLYEEKSYGILLMVKKIALVVGLYIAATALATSFFKYSSYSNTLMDGSALFSTALRSRWESWKILWGMIIHKPVFGYGPYKSYFVQMKLYSDNEYLLMWWRYGVVGLFFYLGLFLWPLKKLWRETIGEHNQSAFLFILVMLISALTNNPLTERSISVLFVFLLATGTAKLSKNEEAVAHRE
jgi:O-antigen ligase